MLAGAGHGGVEGNPVAAELLLAIRDFRLPVEPLSRPIGDHRLIYNDPMPSMAALEATSATSSALALAARAAAPSENRASARHAESRKASWSDRGLAAGCRAAPAVRAVLLETWQRDRAGLSGSRLQARATIDQPIGRAPASRAALGLAACRGQGRSSCRWRWSARLARISRRQQSVHAMRHLQVPRCGPRRRLAAGSYCKASERLRPVCGYAW